MQRIQFLNSLHLDVFMLKSNLIMRIRAIENIAVINFP
jgi:hypothetical protein